MNSHFYRPTSIFFFLITKFLYNLKYLQIYEKYIFLFELKKKCFGSLDSSKFEWCDALKILVILEIILYILQTYQTTITLYMRRCTLKKKKKLPRLIISSKTR